MRSVTTGKYGYLGSSHALPVTEDGFATAGDLGWLDAEGYLYIADRRVDMIVSGGANVFPAEVEAALSEHPDIADVVVVGLPDPEWGHRVHAIVERVDDRSCTEEDIRVFAKERLAAYKVPKTVEFIDAIPRSAATKVNRANLVAERTVEQVPSGPQRLRTTTLALAPRPTVWARPTGRRSTWLAPPRPAAGGRA